MDIQAKILHPNGKLPSVSTAGASGADLKALYNQGLDPGETKLIPTGCAFAIPEGYAGFVCSRSGLALKHSVFCLNAPGIIDSDYRGDVGVVLHNAGKYRFNIIAGDRIGQLLLIRTHDMNFILTEELDSTVRGTQGFGSTGVAS